MRSLFGGKSSHPASAAAAPRVARHSSGWSQIAADLRTRDGLRILDIGPTSSTNINHITSLGHSVYMANLVDDAARTLWRSTEQAGGAEGLDQGFDVEGFLAANLDFAGRTFDIILLWDTADYLPRAVLAPVIDRLLQVLEPEGKLLAFFHVKPGAADAGFCRYHLTPSDNVEMQRAGNYPVTQVYNNREIEQLFQSFGGHRFFLAKDNLREVIVTR